MIILDAKQLPTATEADLKETYSAVTGQALESTNIDAMRVKVSMALLSSADLVGHIGVPRDTKPQPKTLTQLRELGKEMNKEKQVEDAIETRFKPGSLADQLYKAQQAMPKIAPREPKKGSGEPRAKLAKVKATFSGESKPQSGSLRSAVLQFIQTETKAGKDTDIDAMEAALGYPVRGHVQKLLEKKHLEVVREEGEE